MSPSKFLLLLLATTCAPAVNALPIISGDGTEQCQIAAGGPCSVQTISVHRLWQPNNPNGQGAEWISYADTGAAGSTLAEAPGGIVENPLMFVREVLEGITAGARLVMDLWADDTAQVDLRFDDGSGFEGGLLHSLLTPDFSQDTCAAGPTGCEPEDRAHFEYTFTEEDIAALNGASVFLYFTTFQVGTGTTNAANPFGLLYSGWLELTEQSQATVPVSEPSPLALLAGMGVFGLVLLRRRKHG
ncbi:MAG TPA: PEP-CTERM sorting domain-containing protein [Pseudomonadales bacterium]